MSGHSFGIFHLTVYHAKEVDAHVPGGGPSVTPLIEVDIPDGPGILGRASHIRPHTPDGYDIPDGLCTVVRGLCSVPATPPAQCCYVVNVSPRIWHGMRAPVLHMLVEN